MARGPQYEVGRYIGKVTHQRLGETSSGKPQLVLSFQVLGMVNLSDPEGDLFSCPQGERSIYRVITEKTLDYAKSDMDSLEWYGDRWSQFDEENPSFVGIIGNEYAFFCKHEPKQAKNDDGEWVAWWTAGEAAGSQGPVQARCDVRQGSQGPPEARKRHKAASDRTAAEEEPCRHDAAGEAGRGGERRIHTVLRRNLRMIKNPVKEIRANCIECSGGSRYEADNCPCTSCLLFAFRGGRNPYRTPRVLSQDQKDANVARLSLARVKKSASGHSGAQDGRSSHADD
jgi:hypothetical protein